MSKSALQNPKKPAKGGKLKQIFSQKRLYAFHSWVGVFAGLLMLLIGFTGSVAVFKPELDWALTPALRVSPGETKVSIDQVVATVSQAYPDRVIKDVELQTGDRWAHIVKVKKHDEHHGEKHDAKMHEDEDEHENESEIFVNPYTGKIEGERQGESAAELVKKFHTNMWFNLKGGDIGKVGRLIVCAFGVMLVILSLTGFWIYRNKLKSLFKIRFTYGRRILMSDMHKVLGVWTIAFNLMIGITATAWGAKEVGKVFEREHDDHDHKEHMHHDHQEHGAMAAKAEKPEKYKKDKKAKMAMTAQAGTGAGNYDALVASAAAAIPEMHIEKVEIKGEHGEFKVKGKASGAVIPQQNVHVELAAGTGEIVMIKDDRSDPVASRLYKFMEPLHFGSLAEGGRSWLEYAVKSLWAILGMSPGLLSVTGFVMYYMRKKAAATRKATVPAKVSQTVRELATDGL